MRGDKNYNLRWSHLAETLLQTYESKCGIKVDRLGINYIYLMFDTADRIEQFFPQLANCEIKYDPLLTNEFSPRLRVRIIINLLHYWNTGDIEKVLAEAFEHLEFS